jgi:hypothetical protein
MASVILTGNPIDGFQAFGPFDTTEEASLFITHEADEIETWVIPVHDPALLTEPVGSG